jgi:predicted nucleotidyltransferase component of viral defense system
MSLSIITHKNALIKILKDIFTDPTIGPVLGFKGGTAAYLFYGLNRFSVDLDFDLLEKTREEHVFGQIKKILESYGSIKDHRKKRYSLFYLLSYQDKERDAQNIKIEINLRDFGSRFELKSYLGIPMKVMVKEDMAAHKLVAMYERDGKTNRDIFDVQFFLRENWPINREIIETRTRMPFLEFLGKCIDIVEKKRDSDILSGIGELLESHHKQWVRTKLKAETLFALKLLRDNENGRHALRRD